MTLFPILTGEIAKRGIKKKAIAQSIGVCDKALNNKLTGKSPFTYSEARTINRQFFPDMSIDELFAEAEEQKGASA